MRLARPPNSQRKVPALFLHIQKTAGTSLIDVVRHHYGDNLTSHGDCWGYMPEKFKNVGFVSGHFGYDYAKHLMPGRFTFTFLRDPVERVLSMYYFCKNRNPEEFMIYRRANEHDLRGFLEAGLTDPWVKKNIWNNQVWQLAHGYAHLDDRTINAFCEEELLSLAIEHLGEFTYVGFTETVDKDSLVILPALGLPQMSAIPKLNRAAVKPGVSDLSPRVRTLLEELTFLDRRFYDYAREKHMSPRGKLNDI